MAGGAVLNSGGDKDYPGKLTMFVLLACIVAATGGLIFGYDIGISGKSASPIDSSRASSSFHSLFCDCCGSSCSESTSFSWSWLAR
jgi:hypothetical protein